MTSLIRVLLRAAGFDQPIHNPGLDADSPRLYYTGGPTNWSSSRPDDVEVTKIGEQTINGISGTVYEIKPRRPSGRFSMSDQELLERMVSINGEYQGRRLHKIVEMRDGSFEANVMEGMQLVGDFGFGPTPGAAIRKALLASGCDI